MVEIFGRHPAARVALVLLLLGSGASIASGEEPRERFAVELQETKPAPAAASAAENLPVAVLLDDLENQVVAIEAGSVNSPAAAQVRLGAEQALARATTASERIRADACCAASTAKAAYPQNFSGRPSATPSRRPATKTPQP